MVNHFLWMLLGAVLILAACGERTLFAPAGVDQLVIDAVLIVDAPFPELRLGRSGPPDRPWTLNEFGENSADIMIRDSVGGSWAYQPAPGRRGVYLSPLTATVVEAATRYDLEVIVAGDTLRATTTTPSVARPVRWLRLGFDGVVADSLCRFEVCGPDAREEASNQLVYNGGLLEARVEKGSAAGAQLLLRSLDLDSGFAIDPEFFDPEDFDELDRANASPVFLVDDGQIRLPWFAIYFLGDYRLELFRVDRNWYDLVRSSPEFNGGGGFGQSPGEGFQRPIYHVDGGLGLFGSATVDSIGLRILPARGL